MQLETAIDLNDRETIFVAALAAGKRPTRAAVTAGFAASHATNLLRRTDIKAALLAVASNAKAILSELEAS